MEHLFFRNKSLGRKIQQVAKGVAKNNWEEIEVMSGRYD